MRSLLDCENPPGCEIRPGRENPPGRAARFMRKEEEENVSDIT